MSPEWWVEAVFSLEERLGDDWDQGMSDQEREAAIVDEAICAGTIPGWQVVV
jgi:hypothetical protein